MPNISISINDSAARALISRAPDRISFAIRGALEDGSTYVLAKIKRYPAQRAGSSYVRTHALEKSWSRRLSGSGANQQAVIGSNSAAAPYNRYVQDRDRQANQHRGRWQTIQSVAEDSQPVIVRMFEDRLRAAGLNR